MSRCKERKQFMNSSMAARNAFAAAHSSFIMSLKNTGAALSDFAGGESINPYSLSSSAAVEREKGLVAGGGGGSPLPPPPIRTLPPPPPPIPDMPPAPLQRAVSMPEFAVSKNKPVSSSEPEPIIEEGDEEEDEEDEQEEERLTRRRHHMKGSSAGGRMEMEENRGPPPQANDPTYDYFFNVENIPNGSLEDVEEMRREREGIVREVFDEMPKRESGDKSLGEGGSERVMEERKLADKPPLHPSHLQGGSVKGMKKGKQVPGPARDRKSVV